MSEYVLSKGDKLSYERNDCTVIALATACELPYPVAHEICKKRGRKDKKGFNLSHVFRIKSREKNEITCTLGENRYRIIRIGNYYDKMTIRSFIKIYKEGNYICSTYNHAFCVKNGRPYNQYNWKQIVRTFYKVIPLTIH